MTTIKINNKRSRKLNDKTEHSDFQLSVFMEFQMDVLRQCAEIPDFFLPGNGMFVIFGPKKCSTQSQLASWILRFQFKIFFEVRNCLRRVLPEGRGGSHCIVVICILRLELDGFCKRVSGFCNKAQIHAHEAKVVMQTCIAGLQVSRVRQVTKGPL